jgi:hypothetical protein
VFWGALALWERLGLGRSQWRDAGQVGAADPVKAG